MPAKLVLSDIALPLRSEESGYIRIGRTKVRLDQVVQAYNDGYTVEGILDAWDTLDESDVYAVIAYYLNNRQEVDEYCEDLEREEDEFRREWEKTLTPQQRALQEALCR